MNDGFHLSLIFENVTQFGSQIINTIIIIKGYVEILSKWTELDYA
jgi:hypothetical protein